MKTLILTLMFVFTSVSGAIENDMWVGLYKATDGDGTAIISKEIKTEATLFEPAVYSYQVMIIRSNDDINRIVELEFSKDGKTLTGSNSDDCDNPDCHAFNNFEVTVSTKQDKLQVELIYDGYNTTDEDHDFIESFEGTAIFIKE